MPPSRAIERKNTPNNCICRRMIPDQRLWGPIVGVRISEIRAESRTSPSRPAKECGQLSNLLGVGDVRGPQSKPVSGVPKKPA